jgi:hypothetical protein
MASLFLCGPKTFAQPLQKEPATIDTSVSNAGLHLFGFYITDDDDVGPSPQQIAIEKVMQRERQLQEEEMTRRIQPNGSDDISIWANFMQWDKTFDMKDLRVIKITFLLSHRRLIDPLVDQRHSPSSSQLSSSPGPDED